MGGMMWLELMRLHGVADGFFINGKAKLSGPVKEEQVRASIGEELAR